MDLFAGSFVVFSMISNEKQWCAEMNRRTAAKDGKQIVNLLKSFDFSSSAQSLLKGPVGSGISLYLQFLHAHTAQPSDPLCLEPLTNCIRKICAIYSEENQQWLFPVVVFLLPLCRKMASKMDAIEKTAKWSKKVVEVFREVFPSLHKERECLPGTCWLICQLLHLYMSLDQVKLCAHILAALTQTLVREGGFRPEMVPVPVGITLYFLWAKYLVMESKYREAHDKLFWAFRHAKSPKQLKKIIQYLIPTMIVSGTFPKPVLVKACGLAYYAPLTDAIRTGDLGVFNMLIQTHAQSLAASGTLLLMEKCKRLCARNLAKRTVLAYRELAADSDADASKIDLDLFSAAWAFAEQASTDEMICALADLIYSGEIKGYIALEHNKLVLSKTNPFPSIADLE